MQFNKLLFVSCLTLCSMASQPGLSSTEKDSSGGGILISCEATRLITLKDEGNLIKVQLIKGQTGLEILVTHVSIATSNAYSEDSWDIWTMAEKTSLTQNVSMSWTGHPIMALSARASFNSGNSSGSLDISPNSTIQHVEIHADPSSPQPNGSISINGQAPTAATCR